MRFTPPAGTSAQTVQGGRAITVNSDGTVETNDPIDISGLLAGGWGVVPDQRYSPNPAKLGFGLSAQALYTETL